VEPAGGATGGPEAGGGPLRGGFWVAEDLPSAVLPAAQGSRCAGGGQPATPQEGGKPANLAEATHLAAVEKNHILAVLRESRWVIDGPRGAARILNIHPNTLRSRLKRLGIVRPSHEPS